MGGRDLVFVIVGGLTVSFINILPLFHLKKNSSSLKYSKLSFLNRKICYSSVISICSNNIPVVTCHNN